MLQRVFNDGQSQTGTTDGGFTRIVNTIKALGQPADMLCRDAGATVADTYFYAVKA